MKIYIAGPISGHDPIWVDTRFKTAALELRILGIEPINPTDMSGWGLSWKAYMRIAETILKTGGIDGVLMLEGWEQSKGARIEHAWAVTENIPIYYEEDGILEPSQKLKKEWAERAYDAIGDDQGRGGSTETRIQDPGDSWYRENFVEKYDDQPEVFHKYEETDGVIKIKKQSAKAVGEIKNIVVCSPNYTRYFYNASMPTPYKGGDSK